MSGKCLAGMDGYIRPWILYSKPAENKSGLSQEMGFSLQK